MNSANARFLLNWVSLERSSSLNCSSNVQSVYVVTCLERSVHILVDSISF